MTKLCQVVAVANGVKSRITSEVTQIYHTLQSGGLFEGLSRTYSPKFEDGDVYPAEEKILQTTVDKELEKAVVAWTELLDVVATQDWGNRIAVADVVVDGETVLTSVPATTLIFLEKQLQNVRSVLSAAKVLDATKRWSWSENAACWQSEPSETVKTKKKLEIIVAYEATPQHPAQLREQTVDVVEGNWKKIDYSGALSATRKNLLMSRVDKLLDAVKAAREEANSTAVEPVKFGDSLFGWLMKE